MKRITIFLAFAFLTVCSQAPAPTENQTALAPERVGAKSFDYGVGVAVDTKRNAVYAVVSTDGSLAGKNLGGRDTFLQRYKRNGQVVWSRPFGSPDNDYVTDIAVDEKRGFVYVVIAGVIWSETLYVRVFHSSTHVLE